MSVEQEDRGTHYRLWCIGGSCFFEPPAFPRGGRPDFVVSAPKSWNLRPDEFYGVVLESTFLVRLSAHKVLNKARAGADGFRIVEERP